MVVKPDRIAATVICGVFAFGMKNAPAFFDASPLVARGYVYFNYYEIFTGLPLTNMPIYIIMEYWGHSSIG